jgi:steroid delta-isomerase-like uncharacterized protein
MREVDSMSAEENRRAVHRFFEEVWNRGDVSGAQDFLDPTFVSHNSFGIEVLGPDEYARSVAAFRAAFPDFHTTIEDVLAEGDRVAVRGTDRGTHLGEFMGRPATGRQFAMTWIGIYRIRDGKAVEGWLETDTKRFLDQLEATASPGKVGEPAG